MGIFDKAKDALSDHPEQVDSGIDKVGDLADDKYADKVDQGQEFIKDKLGNDPAVDPAPPA